MMKVLESKSSDLTSGLVAKYGNYNSFPDGWTEVTDDRYKVDSIFLQLLDGQWVATETRQMYPPGPPIGPMVQATLYFTTRQNGFAISRVWSLKDNWVNRFYVFGCQHKKNDSKTLGSCYHQYICSDCGYAWTVDSSG